MSGAQQHLDLERLARVIAMGGSGHDGEALAALRQADRSIRDAGMTWHDVLLPGRLIEALAAEVQQLRDELTALRVAKAAETQQLRDALTAARHRRRPTQHQRGAAPVGIIILGCIAAMYIMFGDIIGGCAGGAVPVANSSPNITGISLPATVASSACTQRPPDEARYVGEYPDGSTNVLWRDCDRPQPARSDADTGFISGLRVLRQQILQEQLHQLQQGR
jgi:hypothetical protein